MYFKSHISITNRFVLPVTYFKSCSRILSTLIFFMGRCRTKKNRCYTLHIHYQWSSELSKISFPAVLCTEQNESEVLGWFLRLSGHGGERIGISMLGWEAVQTLSEAERSWSLSHRAGSSRSDALSAQAPSYTNVISSRTQRVCTNEPPRPRSGNYCTCFLSRTKLSAVMELHT